MSLLPDDPFKQLANARKEFERLFSTSHFPLLPSPVSREGVQATYRNGVLEVRMQKTTQNIVQNIDIDFY